MTETYGDAVKAGEASVKSGVVAYLALDGAMKAIEFYKAAFGAEVAAVIPPDDKGRTMHAHVYINGGSLMMSDFFPEHGHVPVAPQGFTLMVQVDDVDTWWKRAVDAGCTVSMPLQDMFWGSRYGQLKDPFGVTWALNSGPMA
jgi:PhnB protein